MTAERAERLIEGGGTPESEWQGWLARLQPVPAALFMPLRTGARLVVIAPHPDDELLACGGVLGEHLAQGGEALVVAVTDGEASHGAASPRSAARLAADRRDERREGLRRLGLGGARGGEGGEGGAGHGAISGAVPVERLGLPDGKVADHVTDLTQRLMALLRPTDLVLSTWRLDGHPDHDASGDAAAQACTARRARLIEAPVWMWHWARPGDPRVPWQRLRAHPLEAPAVQRKLAALAAHTTQLDPRKDGQGPVLGAQILARAARCCECFFV